MSHSPVITPQGTELPILNLRGKPYLEVKYRLVWFREEHPDWGIETEIVFQNENMTRTKATIRNEKGQIMAQSHKTEDVKGFADHQEKSETGAIGRALALCGFGTQFAPEIEEGERIVDSPAEPVKRPIEKKAYEKPVNHAPQKDGKISEAQAKRLFAIAKSKDWPVQELARVCNQGYGVSSSRDLDRFSYDELCAAIEAGTTPDEVIKSKRG